MKLIVNALPTYDELEYYPKASNAAAPASSQTQQATDQGMKNSFFDWPLAEQSNSLDQTMRTVSNGVERKPNGEIKYVGANLEDILNRFQALIKEIANEFLVKHPEISDSYKIESNDLTKKNWTQNAFDVAQSIAEGHQLHDRGLQFYFTNTYSSTSSSTFSSAFSSQSAKDLEIEKLNRDLISVFFILNGEKGVVPILIPHSHPNDLGKELRNYLTDELKSKFNIDLVQLFSDLNSDTSNDKTANINNAIKTTGLILTTGGIIAMVWPDVLRPVLSNLVEILHNWFNR